MQDLPSAKETKSSSTLAATGWAPPTPSTLRWELGTTPRRVQLQPWVFACGHGAAAQPVVVCLLPVRRRFIHHPMPPPAATSTGTAVYVAAVPLRAPRGPAQLLMSAGYSLGAWDLQHFMVLLRPDPSLPQALVFDFLPRDPEDALAALAVLSRSEIPGVVRRRTLRRVPDRRCWLVGHCCFDGDDDAVAVAGRFSERWPTGLVVGEHDCRDYTNGLVEVLTGEKRVLESLRLGGGTTTTSSGAAAP